jgi:hypothetical protein
MSNGKGSRYRPVNKQLFDENFERIFRKEELHAPAPHPTCTVCGDPDCNNWKAQPAPAAEAPVRSPSPAAGEDVLGCDSEQQE